MAIKFKHDCTFSTYFITFTCIDWIPLFETTNSYDTVYKWFGILKEAFGADVIAYVIMPNHVHVLLHFQKEGFNLNTIVGNGKRFMAYEIIDRLEKMGNSGQLQQLQKKLTDCERKKGQLHKVFISSFDAKPIFSQRFLLQKINYIHMNPVSGKWNLAADFIAYRHSSASFYERQQVQYFKPLHYMDL